MGKELRGEAGRSGVQLESCCADDFYTKATEVRLVMRGDDFTFSGVRESLIPVAMTRKWLQECEGHDRQD